MNIRPILFTAFFALPLGCHAEPADSHGIYHISFSPKGTWLVGAGGFVRNARQPPWGGGGIVKVWKTSTWKLADSSTQGFSDPVENIFFVTENTYSVTTNNVLRETGGNPYVGTWLRTWDIAEKKEMPKLHLGDMAADRVDYHSQTKRIAQSAFLCQIPEMKDRVLLEALEGQKSGTEYLKFSPDGKRVLSCMNGRDAPPALRLHDASTGKQIAKHELDRMMPHRACFSPTGKMVAIAARNADPEISKSKIYVLRSNLSEILLALDLEFPASFVTFAPDNESIAIEKDNTAVQLYSIKDKMATNVFAGNAEGANCCCFSPDGSLIAIGGGGIVRNGKAAPPKVRVFEVKTGKLVAELE